jgi:hypothetical protein
MSSCGPEYVPHIAKPGSIPTRNNVDNTIDSSLLIPIGCLRTDDRRLLPPLALEAGQ